MNVPGATPITWATEKMPPTLIIHGDADKLVPLYQSQRFMDKVEALKVPHELIVRPGKGHGWFDLSQAEMLREMQAAVERR